MSKKPSKSTKEATEVETPRFYLPVTGETVDAKDMSTAQELSAKKEEVGDVNA